MESIKSYGMKVPEIKPDPDAQVNRISSMNNQTLKRDIQENIDRIRELLASIEVSTVALDTSLMRHSDKSWLMDVVWYHDEMVKLHKRHKI